MSLWNKKYNKQHELSGEVRIFGNDDHGFTLKTTKSVNS